MTSATRESGTRDRVREEISEHGPITAAALADRLGLTPTAVRRHLDALQADGQVAEREARSRGRGRPARAYVLSAEGHRELTGAYDDIATDALRFLAETAGPQAVEAFAEQRVCGVERRYQRAIDAAGDDVHTRAQALARALSDDGYAATTRTVTTPGGGTAIGLQICQGHCPVQHVATEFPQICEAEREVFARLLGANVQRLATLAHGEHVCTTFVPLTPAPAEADGADAPPAEGSRGAPGPHDPTDQHDQTISPSTPNERSTR